jgi:signal transduction histidine kinase
MKGLRRRLLCWTGGILTGVGFAAAEPVDPRFPSEWVTEAAIEWSDWLPTRIEQLEAEQAQLLEQISVLPQHDPVFSSDHLGYHSSVGDPESGEELPPHQLVIKLAQRPLLDSVALVPAFNPSESRSYAFPKRFKIEVMRAATKDFEIFVNWMDEDFPDPGLYPVFFSGLSNRVTQIRLTVPQVMRKSDEAYFALGEIYLFRSRSDGRMGANALAWGNEIITVSDSFSMPPYWSQQYLHDGQAGFGAPLSDQRVESEDLMVTYEKGEAFSDQVQVTMDLGRLRPIGRIDLWPAAAPYRLALPSFGFPGKIAVEISRTPDFVNAKVFKKSKVLKPVNAGAHMYGGSLFSIIGKATPGRYVRITMEGLSEYKGRPILGLGEISVSNNEYVLSRDCKLTAQGIPPDDLEQLPRLVDGYARQRRILLQGEWIKGLAQRRPLDRRLAAVERELELARATLRRIQLRSSIWGGGIVATTLAVGLVLQRRQRLRHAKRLREQISSDLHDDIGSKVAAISLASTYVEKNAAESSVRRRGARIQAIASAMHRGLRNVLWLTDTRTDTLDQLVQKLADCARIGIAAERLSLKTSPIRSVPAKPVNVQTKRDLLLFFEEVLHNAASHSDATRISVEVLVQGKKLHLQVQDNGIGFELPAEDEITDSSIHHGLRTMNERSKRLRGQLEIQSVPGRGTTVELWVSV